MLCVGVFGGWVGERDFVGGGKSRGNKRRLFAKPNSLTYHHSSPPHSQQAIDAFERAREEELIGAVDPALYDAVLGCYRKTGAMEKVRVRCVV